MAFENDNFEEFNQSPQEEGEYLEAFGIEESDDPRDNGRHPSLYENELPAAIKLPVAETPTIVSEDGPSVDLRYRAFNLLEAMTFYSGASKLEGLEKTDRYKYASPREKQKLRGAESRYEDNGYQYFRAALGGKALDDSILASEFKDTYIGPHNKIAREKFRKQLRKQLENDAK